MLMSLLKNMKRQGKARPENIRRLHIGGLQPKPGWEILNAAAGSSVDHVGSAADLSRFPDETFLEIYSSHVLEHLDFKAELQAGLREWCRVLTKGGKLYVSVPDLDTLSRLILRPDLSLSHRFHVVRMIFGAHSDEHDYHKVGLNFEILKHFLNEAGFVRIERVSDFGLFNDTSTLVFADESISLNVTAYKPE